MCRYRNLRHKCPSCEYIWNNSQNDELCVKKVRTVVQRETNTPCHWSAVGGLHLGHTWAKVTGMVYQSVGSHGDRTATSETKHRSRSSTRSPSVRDQCQVSSWFESIECLPIVGHHWQWEHNELWCCRRYSATNKTWTTELGQGKAASSRICFLHAS